MEPVATVAGQGFGVGVPTGSVQRIAQQGGAGRRAVDADLVGAATADRHFHQVGVAASFEQGEVAARSQGGGSVGGAAAQRDPRRGWGWRAMGVVMVRVSPIRRPRVDGEIKAR